MLKGVNSFLLYVSDLSKSKTFYESLGFTFVEESENHFVVRLNWFKIQCFDQSKAEFKIDFEAKERGLGVFFYVSVDDVDAYYKDLISKGIKPSTEPRDWSWGNREFVVKDPDGYRYVFYKQLK